MIQQQNIYLIGFMGSGKSTLGASIADRLGYAWVDLDELLVQRHQMSIAQVFKQYGEQFFRKEEATMLRSTAAMNNTIISCGGGTPCFFDNMDWINRNGLSVFLDPAVSVLVERLKPGKDKRPLLKGKSDEELAAFIEHKMAERYSFYLQAKVHFQLEQEAEDSSDQLYHQIVEYLNQ